MPPTQPAGPHAAGGDGDGDRLNTRARNAARQAGTVHGAAIQPGTTSWQAGDLLRTRRNNRQIPIGTAYVPNGDRFRVIGPSIDGGLLVEDLTGRGRTTLPASYVAQHAQYGWASTIDGAQGATAHIGLLLVRAGLDREHLYVGMTRGRHANHAHVAPDPADHDGHRVGTPPQPFILEAAHRLLADCLARVGAQQAAHTVIDQTRKAVKNTPILKRLRTISVPCGHRRAQREPRTERTLKLMNLPPRGLPKHLTTNGPITHKPPAPAVSPTQQTGYSLER